MSKPRHEVMKNKLNLKTMNDTTDWKKFWDRPRHEIMKDFADRMTDLYNIAEGLRDCSDGDDKDIFNQTRGALYDLQHKARQQYYRWRPEQ